MRNAMLTAIAVVITVLGAAGARPAVANTPPTGAPCRFVEWPCARLQSTIAFTSSRDDPNNPLSVLGAGEIYLANPDGTNLRRLTNNTSGDAFATLSPDGRKIIFDSNRLRTATEPVNTSDLFLMNPDGSQQTWLIRGASPTWAPHGRRIAFHRSASGTGLPILPFPGAATADSDIFVANLHGLLAGSATPRNITRDWTEPDGQRTRIADDPDWSPHGNQIAFTSHSVTDNPSNATSAEIYVVKANGRDAPRQLTFNGEEERGPAWSPDGTRIAYACRKPVPPPAAPGAVRGEICVIEADGTDPVQLTTTGGLTPTWSPDGRQLVFHRPGLNQLFIINADGTGLTQITSPPGFNQLANWGEILEHDR